ncbi:MAG: 16S rRNA (adenine(1518)-N(6)/adenine(1519)-N(6))-dimethyltransferase RsmA [Acetobacteraceae bacterium]|nr:16S rRNA (adenine(1518)-N(6)/adenine(1519)-N(6))-dimethyltransferase RsmA [Acetobacteraceae bacterium]
MGTPVNLTAGSQVRRLLERYGVRPSRRLGQHFLVDANVVRQVVEAAGVEPRDWVLEVGPGLGALTQALLARAAGVVAVEVDRRLVRALEESLGRSPGLVLVQGDALRVDLAAVMSRGGPQWKAVASPPYYLVGPLLARLLQEGRALSRLVLVVQREVAERVVAGPGSSAYGVLSVLVAYHARARVVARVSPACFYPPPAVDSAVVRLDRRPAGEIPAAEAPLLRVVRAAFGQRRKTLLSALAGARELGMGREGAARALEAAGIDGRRRGETLGLEEFCRLSEAAAALGKTGPGGV